MQTSGIAAAHLCKLLKKLAETMGFEPCGLCVTEDAVLSFTTTCKYAGTAQMQPQIIQNTAFGFR
jgi:hypothetical protein